LEDLEKAHIFEPNNVFSLNIRGDVKRIIEDYVGALEDFEKGHVLKSTNTFILMIVEDVKKILKDCWRVGRF